MDFYIPNNILTEMSKGTREESAPWHEVLYVMLESPDVDDEAIVAFIEDEVPDEGETLDYKEDLYISADPPHHQKNREATLMRYFSALANVRTPARNRYLFVGFDDSGEFTGMQYHQPRGGKQVLDDSIDDADIRNVFADKVEPSPTFEVFKLNHDNKEGGVIVVRQAEQVPLTIEKTLRKNGGGEFICKGQAYTRDGSRTIRMEHNDFVEMIRYREELITEKIQDLTQGLSRVVGIPDDQLANLDLNVTPSDEGIPVSEYITTDPTETPDERLTSAVKTWKSTQSLEFDRQGLYEFFADRDELDLDDDEDEEDAKTEFLIRACLGNYLHGSYWIPEYDHDVDDLIETILAEDIDGNTLPPLERVLLVMGKRSYLQRIADNNEWDWGRSKAENYVSLCYEADHIRVREYTGKNIRVNGTSYSVQNLVYGSASEEPENLMGELVNDLVDDDHHVTRGKFRNMELVYLARNS